MGGKINARGIYRDAVHNSDSIASALRFVKCSRLRWVSVRAWEKIPWANRVWTRPGGRLPFLTALTPGERWYTNKLRGHKKLTDWARQLLLQVKRWVGERSVVAVSDSSYAVISLLSSLQGQVSLTSRLRLDAALYEPIPVRPAGHRGRRRLKGNRLPTRLAMAADKQTHWEPLTVSEWYGGQSQVVVCCRDTSLCGAAVPYHPGKKPVATRWVLVRLNGKLTGLVSDDPQIEAH